MDHHYIQGVNTTSFSLLPNQASNTSSIRTVESIFVNSSSNSQSCSQLHSISGSQDDHRQMVESTLSSFWIGDILESISLKDDITKEKLTTCSCNDGYKAQYFCHDCSEHLCDKCVMAHNRVSLTKMHNIVKVSNTGTDFGPSSVDEFHKSNFSIMYPTFSEKEDTSTCKVHLNEVLNYFCEICSYPICTQCTLCEHKEHKFHLLKQVVEENRTLVNALVITTRQNLQKLHKSIYDVQHTMDQVVNKCQIVQCEVHSVVHKHMLALKQRETELINKVHQIKLLKCQLLNAQLEQLQALSNKLQLSLDSVSEVVETDCGFQIIKAREKLENQIKACEAHSLIVEDDGVLFMHPDSSLLLALNTFGNIKSSVCAQQCIFCKDGGTPGIALCGSSVLFSILSRDHSGVVLHTKPEVFDVIVTKPDSSVMKVNVVDAGGARYIFHLHVVLEGSYTIVVHCRGVPIQGTPYILKVKVSNNYKARSLTKVPTLIFGKEGDKSGELCRPWGICCDKNGFLIIADRSNNRVQVFNPDGSFHHMFGTPGTHHGQFDRPAGIAIDNKGHIVVVDKDNHRVQIFHFDGTFVSTFGEKGSKHGQFNYPWDVAINQAGNIAVTDTRNHRIQLFSFDGTFLNKYGFEGAMWKHFDSPRGIAFTPNNLLIVTDFNNHRLVIISPDMKSARYLGSEGSRTSQFLRPQGVAVDEEGNIVVADSRNHRIQIFSPSGCLLAVFGGASISDDVLNDIGPTVHMDRPSGVAITPNGHIAVVDFGNNRVLLY